MDEEEYLEFIREQLRAYGFSAEDVPPEMSADEFYTLEKKSRGCQIQKCVSIFIVEESKVLTTQVLVEEMKNEVLHRKDDSWTAPPHHVIGFPLIISPSVTKPMETFVKEGHSINDDGLFHSAGQTFVIPALVGLEDERLVYSEQSKYASILKYGRNLSKEAEKMFQM